MARLVTLQTLTNRVAQRSNLQVASNAAIWSSAEMTDNINEGIAELYTLIIMQQNQPYYLQSVEFFTTGHRQDYIIGPGTDINAPDFYQMKGLDIIYGPGFERAAQPFMWHDRDLYKYINGWSYGFPVAYRLMGKSNLVAAAGLDSLRLQPQPSGAFKCRFWYFPIAPYLVNPNDTFDGINGFEEHVVLSASIKLLEKQEQFEHVQYLEAKKDKEENRILAMFQAHDADNPERVQDVSRHYGNYNFGFSTTSSG
jgi:hypothetical protein